MSIFVAASTLVPELLVEDDEVIRKTVGFGYKPRR
jgi:hypothetical protein